MTITVTDPVAGPFTPTGIEQVIPFEFKVFDGEQVEVIQTLADIDSGEVLDPADYTVTPNTDLVGAVVEGGTITLTADPDLGLLYFRLTPTLEQEQVWSDTGSRLSNLNEALDRIALHIVSIGHRIGGLLKAPINAAAGYLALDADGRTVMASGTGADAALRADLGLSSGAALVGTTFGGSVQAALNAMLVQQGRYARDYVPFGGDTYYGDVWPNAVNFVAAARMSATLILVRCWKAGVIDEFVVRDPAGYAGVTEGWQIVSHRGFRAGQAYEWFVNPDEDGAMTIVDFAVRIGPYDQPYHSGGEGPIYAFSGFGHGRMVSNGTPQIILDGAGANLNGTANWPVGVRKNGDSLSISHVQKLKFWTNAAPEHAYWSDAEAVSLTRTLAFGLAGGVNQVLSDTVTLTPLIANVGIQDAYAPMAAANSGGYVNRAKLDGYAAVELVADNAQKGNWNPPSSGTKLQFYNSAEPRIAQVTEIVYGPPLRINGVDQFWSKNLFARIHVTDGDDFAKFRVFFASSEQLTVPPRTAWELAMGQTWSMLTRRRTDYLPGGVA